MNKQFESHTIVTQDFTVDALINEQLPSKFSGLEKTELEDPDFNKVFNVFTNDEVEARYILTTAFMERFKELKLVFGAKRIRAAFFNNSLLIALSCHRDMFSLGNLLKPVTDSGQIQELFEEFLAVLSIIDLLKLDSKLGL